MKVFLGGTVNGSKWRDKLIPMLKVDYFNPVVDNWNEEAQKQEIEERKNAEFCLYVLTPKMEGFYSIAEVTDDSFKKADKTIFCYLEEDQGKTFSQEQLDALENLGKLVTANGGLWKSSINEVAHFLNSSLETAAIVKTDKSEFKNVFISYGRRHSLAFAQKLYYRLNSVGHSVWFDMNDIPIGVDFQEQIDEGIQKADNFIFIISPHSVNSIYCYKEIVLAQKYNKRIIPILHVEPEGLWNKIHPDISKINWIYSRQKENFDIAPDNWEDIDDFNVAFESVNTLINEDKDYVHLHTVLLHNALQWAKNQKQAKYLLHGDKRHQSIEWLLKRDFKYPDGKSKQIPVIPTDIHAEYIIESKKNAENLMTDCFLAYVREDIEAKELIRKQLNLNGISTWSDTVDIKKGARFKEAIEKGVAEADNFIFLISPKSVNSKETLTELDIAIKYKKRIIPLLISPTEDKELPLKLRAIQYIDFTDRTEKRTIEITDQQDVVADVESRKENSPLIKSVNELLIQLKDNHHYYHLHKQFLAQCLKWQTFGKPDSMLLRDYNLENALSWLKLSENQSYKSTQWHKEYISASQAIAGTLDSEIFISYSRSDGDFARKLNFTLQTTGKTTWFDQENIPSATDFNNEISAGIEQSNNFVFLISPNSISSDYCLNELKQAVKANKRIITLLSEKSETEKLPKEIKSIQWIDFVSKDYNSAVSELIRLLDTDKEHITHHSLYARDAKRWEEAGKTNDYALRGQELEEAQNWLKIADEEEKNPPASSLQREFIERSKELLIIQLQKETQQRRIKRLLFIVLFLGFFALLFGVFAYRNYLQSEKQKQIALIEREKAEKNEIIATNMAAEARKQATIAEKQSKLALEQKLIAEQQTLIALNEKRDALEARRLADSARAMADRQKQYAIYSKKRAEKSEKEAIISKKRAEQAEERTHYFLYAFNAKNMANEALINSNFLTQAYLATTAIELNYIADSLSHKYNIPHPYMPSLWQALLVNYLQKNNTILLAQQTKDLIILKNQIYFGKSNGGLAKAEINENKYIKLENITDLSTPEIGYIYSLVNIEDKLFFSTSESKIYYLYNHVINDISSYLSYNVNKLIKMPQKNSFIIRLNNGNFIIFDSNQLAQSTALGSRLNETNNIDKIIFPQFYKELSWKRQSPHINSIASIPAKSIVFSNNGNGKIIYTNPQTAEEFPKGHSGQISCLSLSSDNKWLASGSFDGTIMIWFLPQDSMAANKLLPISIQTKNSKYISALSFTSDNRYLIYSDNEKIGYIPMNIQTLYNAIKKQNTISKNQQNKWWQYYKRGEIYPYKGVLFSK